MEFEELEKTIFNPVYNKQNELSLGFILSVLFCSKIEDPAKQIIYLFYIGNIIPHDFLKHEREKIDKEFLLKLIFELSANKKIISKQDLRVLTNLKIKDTFNKYFGEHINKCGLSKNRVYTLSETFQILKFWQGDDKWGRMKAYAKGELANRFMDGNYENLELEMTSSIFEYDYYNHHDYVKPADYKKFINKVLNKESLELIYEEDFNTDYLTFFFYLHLLYTFKHNMDNTKALK